ncbi:Fc receptor-like protein 5 isoform X3 [Salminus brasiliensis]|uniref:Fc receptor-like protein 5 isoform X3 n=1 Tax=Salminus brasiliensis TaxID=930266 RepID=UPI003B82C689
MGLVKFILITAAVTSMVLKPSKEENTTARQPTLLLKQRPDFNVIYTGEQVTLTCDVQEQSSDWKYYWYKIPNKSQQLNSDTSMSSYIINAAELSHNGTYVCQVKRGDNNDEYEGNHDLTIKKPPQPNIILISGWKNVFSGENVALKCESPDKSTGWEYAWFQNTADAGKENTLSISSIKKENEGPYTCQTELQGRPLTRVKSTGFSFTVYAGQPTLLLKQRPDFNVIYTGEQVTLTCEVQEQSSDWKYYWYKIPNKSQQLNSDTSTPSYIINAAKLSHNGTYVCQVKRGDNNNKYEINHDLTIKRPPQPNIILISGWKNVFSDENVVLKCESPDKSTGWKYVWFQNTADAGKENTLSISSIKKENEGPYTCQTELQGRPLTRVKSTEFVLTVYGQPTLLLKQRPDFNVIYTGEQVTLTCEVQEQSSDWKYYWYKIPNKSQQLNSDTSTPSYIINAAKLSHNGTYVCQVKRGDNNNKYEINHDLTIKRPPQPNIILISGWKNVFSGENVVLKCESPDKSTGWKYVWFQNTADAGKENTLSISSIKKENEGPYTCQTELQGRPLTRVKSTEFVLTVYAGQPTLLLKQRPDFNVIYTGEQVTLTCEVQEQSSDWKYYWYKIPNKSQPLNSDTSTPSYIINAAKPSHNGTYVCQVKRGDNNNKYEINHDLTIKRPPQPNIILISGWKNVFSGENVVLKCESPDKSTGWKYVWFQNTADAGKENTLSISSIKKENEGPYTCQTELQGRPLTRVKSTEFVLTVYAGQPTLLLKQRPDFNVIYTGEQVTLTCEVQEQSSDWKYYWYKIPNKSQQLNSDTSTPSYIINTAELSHNGTYVCQVKRGDNNNKYEINHDLTIKRPPQPNIILISGWKNVFSGENVALKCESPDKSTGWEYAWFQNTADAGKENTLSISSIKKENEGPYTCQTELQGRPLTRVKSTEFVLTVYARPLAVLTLQTSWSDIMSVDSLTLKCEVQNDTFGSWNYSWYKDGVFEETVPVDTYNVKATEETFKSEYKCRGNRTERPLYSSFSEGFKANNIVLKRKVLLAFSGCIVCSIVLLIIGCIVLRFTRKKEMKEPVKQDLFFSMTELKRETSSPLHEYLKENGPPLDKEEHNESIVLLNDAVTAVSDQMKDVIPYKENGGFTSFKVEKSALKEKDGLQSKAVAQPLPEEDDLIS